MSQEDFVMNWDDLLSPKRARKSSSKNKLDGRNPFEKDYHRIILSASFRRLQDKTQVFPLDKSDFVRTRLTHSIEVSSLAKSLGAQTAKLLMASEYENVPTKRQAEEIADLLLCAGLLHDMGNPPFGHYGETTIKDYYKTHLSTLEFKGKPIKYYLSQQEEQDLIHFEGNAQVIRLVTKLHYLIDEHGMNLTYSLLNVLMKYPVNSLMVDPSSADVRYQKLGYFTAEKDLFNEITKETGTRKPLGADAYYSSEAYKQEYKKMPQRSSYKQLSIQSNFADYEVVRHPLTFLLEAADDISYRTADIEDASRKSFITYMELRAYLEDNQRLEKADQETKQAYQKVLKKLDECRQDAHEKHQEKADLYAIQNWIVYIQGFLVNLVSQEFLENYESIMRGTYNKSLVNEDTLAGLILDVLGDIAYDYVFSSQTIVELEVSADAVLKGLLAKFVPAAINYDTDIEQKPVNQRLISLISDNYRDCYHRESQGKSEADKLYYRLLLVNDYICGMTDSFAKNLYYKFNGIYD